LSLENKECARKREEGREEGRREKRKEEPRTHTNRHERALPLESPKGHLQIGRASDQKASSARGAHAPFVCVCVGSWLNPSSFFPSFFRALSVFSVAILLDRAAA
jgi:hypothetical protein